MGVQKGTVYEAWANENIASNSGSGGGVFTYQNADDMINALKAKQIDVVLLGKQPALSFQNGGGVKIVGETFAQATVCAGAAQELAHAESQDQ